MSDRYILIGQSTVPCEDLIEWATWFETADRRVALTDIGPYTVSTVFLGLDHNFSQEGRPILFETMAWLSGSGDDDPLQRLWENLSERCSTWSEAEDQHRRVVKKLEQDLLRAGAK